jgi:hypothetical protein
MVSMSIFSSNRWLPAAVLTALFVLGCSDSGRLPFDTTDPPPDSTGITEPTEGIVRGTVTGGEGEPLAAALTLYDIDFDASAQDSTDDAGRYLLAVPPGRYRLFLKMSGSGFWVKGWYSSEGLRRKRWEAETLHVAGSDEELELEADVALGALRFTLNAPPELEGVNLSAHLEGGGGINSWEVSGTVRDGRFTGHATALTPGQYHAAVVPPKSRTVYFPGHHRTAVEKFDIEVGETAEQTWTLREPGWVRGSVEGTWQELDAGAPIVLLEDQEGHRMSSSSADAAGDFALPVYFPDSVRFKLRTGRVNRYYDETGFPGVRFFWIEPGEDVSGIDIRDFGIVGDVVGPDGFRPAVGVMDLYSEDGTLIRVEHILSPGGRFGFGNLSLGTYLVGIRVPYLETVPWVPQLYDRVRLFRYATPITVDGTSTVTSIQMTLEWGGVLRGRILDSLGQPYQHATVALTEWYAGDYVGWRHPNSNGEFLFYGLSQDLYRVGVRWRGEMWWYPGTYDPDSATRILIRLGEEEEIVLQLP